MRVCPLCMQPTGLNPVKGPDARVYKHCGKCYLIFTEVRFHPTRNEEEKKYRKLKYGLQYPGYVAFLNTAITPALEFLNPGSHGLDFGCGPEPTLSKILVQKGFSCEDYDPIFFPDLNQEKQYDFIFATECFQHFFYPVKELQMIKGMLKEDGILVILTEQWRSQDKFRNWYYAKDPTHVSFYHQRTFNFIAEKSGMSILFTDNNRVIIFQKTKTHAVS